MFIGNQREQLQEEPAQSLPPLSKQRLETGREGVARERQLLAPPKYGLWVEPRWQCEIDIARDLQVFCWPPPAAAANSDRLPHRLRPAPRARSQRQHIITICHAMRAGDLWVDFDKLLRLSILCGCCIGIECLGTRRSQGSAHVQAADQNAQRPRFEWAVVLLVLVTSDADARLVPALHGARRI